MVRSGDAYQFKLLYPQFSAHVTIGNSINSSNFVTTVTASYITGVNNLCIGTGITETPDFELFLSPNPATTHLTINLGDSFVEGMTYQIVDVLGKIHSSASLSQPTSTLDIQFLSSKLFFLELKYGAKSLSKKFIKE